MVNKKLIPLLLILPALLFILSNLYTDSYTPYFLNYHHDPSYAYLLNSLNLATGHFTGHVEHPGTPLHIIGAAVVRLYHFFSGANDDITVDVLTRPENYLRAINFTILLINSAVLFFLGLSIYSIYKSILPAIFMQMSPFISINIFTQFSDVNAESLLAVPVMLMIIYSFRYVNLSAGENKSELKYLIILSLITGLGISVKLNFFPLILIPLLLFKTFRQRLIIIFTSVISFIVFVLPGVNNYKYFFEWINLLFFKSGMYGGGKSNIVDPSKFLSNLKTIVLTDKLYAFTVIMIFVFLIYIFIKLKRSGIDASGSFENRKKYYRLLTGMFLSMALGCIIVSKHYVSRYMMPYLMLVIPSVFLMVLILYRSGCFKFREREIDYKYVIVLLLIFSIVMNLRNYILTFENSITGNNNAYEIHKVMKNYEGKILISGHLCVNQRTALYFGSSFAGKMNMIYKNKLTELYPDQIIFVGPWSSMYNLSKDSILTDVFSQNKDIIFFSNNYNSPDSLITKIKRENSFIQSGTYETLFVPTHKGKNEEMLFKINLIRDESVIKKDK